MGTPEYPPDKWSIVLGRGAGTERLCGSETVERMEKFYVSSMNISVRRDYECGKMEAGRMFTVEFEREYQISVRSSLGSVVVEFPDSPTNRKQYDSFPATGQITLSPGQHRVLIVAGEAKNETTPFDVQLDWI